MYLSYLVVPLTLVMLGFYLKWVVTIKNYSKVKTVLISALSLIGLTFFVPFSFGDLRLGIIDVAVRIDGKLWIFILSFLLGICFLLPSSKKIYNVLISIVFILTWSVGFIITFANLPDSGSLATSVENLGRAEFVKLFVWLGLYFFLPLLSLLLHLSLLSKKFDKKELREYGRKFSV